MPSHALEASEQGAAKFVLRPHIPLEPHLLQCLLEATLRRATITIEVERRATAIESQQQLVGSPPLDVALRRFERQGVPVPTTTTTITITPTATCHADTMEYAAGELKRSCDPVPGSPDIWVQIGRTGDAIIEEQHQTDGTLRRRVVRTFPVSLRDRPSLARSADLVGVGCEWTLSTVISSSHAQHAEGLVSVTQSVTTRAQQSSDLPTWSAMAGLTGRAPRWWRRAPAVIPAENVVRQIDVCSDHNPLPAAATRQPYLGISLAGGGYSWYTLAAYDHGRRHVAVIGPRGSGRGRLALALMTAGLRHGSTDVLAIDSNWGRATAWATAAGGTVLTTDFGAPSSGGAVSEILDAIDPRCEDILLAWLHYMLTGTEHSADLPARLAAEICAAPRGHRDVKSLLKDLGVESAVQSTLLRRMATVDWCLPASLNLQTGLTPITIDLLGTGEARTLAIIACLVAAGIRMDSRRDALIFLPDAQLLFDDAAAAKFLQIYLRFARLLNIGVIMLASADRSLAPAAAAVLTHAVSCWIMPGTHLPDHAWAALGGSGAADLKVMAQQLAGPHRSLLVHQDTGFAGTVITDTSGFHYHHLADANPLAAARTAWQDGYDANVERYGGLWMAYGADGTPDGPWPNLAAAAADTILGTPRLVRQIPAPTKHSASPCPPVDAQTLCLTGTG